MPWGKVPAGAALVAAMSLAPGGAVCASEPATPVQELAAASFSECERGRTSTDRAQREAAFMKGLSLAERAVALDDENALAHFGIFCNKGELLRIDGGVISSVFKFRDVLRALDRALALDPTHLPAMASKGILLTRLPRLLGGDGDRGEEMLLEVVERDPNAVSSRLALAERCRARGEFNEARAYADRALEIASSQGRPDKVQEARQTLAKIDADK